VIRLSGRGDGKVMGGEGWRTQYSLRDSDELQHGKKVPCKEGPGPPVDTAFDHITENFARRDHMHTAVVGEK